MAIKRNGCEGCTEITCGSTKEVLSKDIAKNVITAYDRVQSRGMSACLFGSGGSCCRNCNMGPCQIIDGVEEMIGVCGATAETVVARNFARTIASGSAAELEYQLLLAHDLAHLPAQAHRQLDALVGEVKRMLYRFIQSLAEARSLKPEGQLPLFGSGSAGLGSGRAPAAKPEAACTTA